jgi:hypothetical protein
VAQASSLWTLLRKEVTEHPDLLQQFGIHPSAAQLIAAAAA